MQKTIKTKVKTNLLLFLICKKIDQLIYCLRQITYKKCQK